MLLANGWTVVSTISSRCHSHLMDVVSTLLVDIDNTKLGLVNAMQGNGPQAKYPSEVYQQGEQRFAFDLPLSAIRFYLRDAYFRISQHFLYRCIESDANWIVSPLLSRFSKPPGVSYNLEAPFSRRLCSLFPASLGVSQPLSPSDCNPIESCLILFLL